MNFFKDDVVGILLWGVFASLLASIIGSIWSKLSAPQKTQTVLFCALITLVTFFRYEKSQPHVVDYWNQFLQRIGGAWSTPLPPKGTSVGPAGQVVKPSENAGTGTYHPPTQNPIAGVSPSAAQVDSQRKVLLGNLIATGEKGGTTEIWDAKSGHLLQTLGGHGTQVNFVSFSPDAKRLATGSYGKFTKIWDVETGKEFPPSRGGDQVFSVDFSPDGTRLATTTLNTLSEKGGLDASKSTLWLAGFDQKQGDPIHSAAFSQDRKRLATVHEHTTAKIWDAQTGKLLLTLRGEGCTYFFASFSPDGKYLASSCDRFTEIWNLKTGKALITFPKQNEPIVSVSFSPDGHRFAAAIGNEAFSYGIAKIWDITTGKLLLTLPNLKSAVLSVALSPDGRRLATGSQDSCTKIWDAETGVLLLTLPGHSAPESIAFSPI